jgi:uncharacterized membrane protein
MQVCGSKIMIMMVVVVVMMMAVVVMIGLFAVKHPDAQHIDGQSDDGDQNRFIKRNRYGIEKSSKGLNNHIDGRAT